MRPNDNETFYNTVWSRDSEGAGGLGVGDSVQVMAIAESNVSRVPYRGTA